MRGFALFYNKAANVSTSAYINKRATFFKSVARAGAFTHLPPPPPPVAQHHPTPDNRLSSYPSRHWLAQEQHLKKVDMGSSADRIWICMKYARPCSHFGHVTRVLSTFFHASSPPTTRAQH